MAILSAAPILPCVWIQAGDQEKKCQGPIANTWTLCTPGQPSVEELCDHAGPRPALRTPTNHHLRALSEHSRTLLLQGLALTFLHNWSPIEKKSVAKIYHHLLLIGYRLDTPNFIRGVFSSPPRSIGPGSRYCFVRQHEAQVCFRRDSAHCLR